MQAVGKPLGDTPQTGRRAKIFRTSALLASRTSIPPEIAKAYLRGADGKVPEGGREAVAEWAAENRPPDVTSEIGILL